MSQHILKLRPIQIQDQAQLLSAQAIMAEQNWEFIFGYEPTMAWDQYVQSVSNRRCGIGLPSGWVQETFLVAVIDQTIVGRISIRHSLTPFLLARGGHIGYGVLPGYRLRGYAGQILSQGLIIARALGIDRVLLTCADNNIGSIKIIESHAGVFESMHVPDDGSTPTRRYWI